jgi:hypothetical protein
LKGVCTPQPTVCAPYVGVYAPPSSVCTPQSAVCAPPPSVCAPQSVLCAPYASVCTPLSAYAPYNLPYAPLTQAYTPLRHAYAPLRQLYTPGATPTIQRGSDVVATVDKVSPDLPCPRSTRRILIGRTRTLSNVTDGRTDGRDGRTHAQTILQDISIRNWKKLKMSRTVQ